jgi:asparagine N-glycosylation enzyme membrane subunit Stt3
MTRASPPTITARFDRRRPAALPAAALTSPTEHAGAPFIGGPFFVMLFIGGTAGVATHVLIPGLPEGLAFAAMFAALPGSLVAAPFSLIMLSALTTQIGTLEIAPVAIAVLTAYLAVSGSGLLMALANRARKPSAKPATPSAPRG